MILRAGYAALALQLQEAMDSGDALSANDIRSRLSDAINDAHRGTGKWAYYIDHFGDGESGDVIYCCDGDTCRASYSIVDTAGAAKCSIDTENAEDVVPRTVYEPEAEEGEHYAAMESAFKAETLYTSLPLYERFIGKKERDAASSDDFAGKGKSFPILKPEDVTAAAANIGRAGPGNMGPSGIKARIIAIAKRKGAEFVAKLPKAWKDGGDSAKESAQGATAGMRLVESAATTEAIVLKEARADYEIKLIAPGKGSSAFYPKEVLQRDGPKVFKANTHVYVNHPTMAEEAARPEGDVKNLAGVLTTDAVYHESHPKGPGLYARMKVFADHGQMVEEKAPHVGMSIRASGIAEANRKQDGVPVLKELTSAESVDVVTRAGAGGMILTEAAKAANPQQEAGMTAEETQKLIEAAVAPFRQRVITGDARAEATRLLETITLPAIAKNRIIERACATVPLTEAGELDVNKLREAVVAESKAEGEYIASLTGGAQVRGMGIGMVAQPAPKPEEIAAREAQRKAEDEDEIGIFESIGMSPDAAKFAARGRVA
jgi:hypothetical protein